MTRLHRNATGGVQGVASRFRREAVAARAHATGWGYIRPDGTVEAEVEGTAAAVEAVVDWARRGPRGGWVDELRVEAVPEQGSTIFEIRRDG